MPTTTLPTINLPSVNTGLFSFGNETAVKQGGLSPLLPSPHDKQSQVLTAVFDNDLKRAVIVAGRRGGKTTGMSMIAAEGLRRNMRVLYAAPTTDQTERFWYAVRSYFQDDIDNGRLVKSETRRLIEPPNSDDNSPRIRAKTAYDADTIRGDWGDLVLLDEYSLMSGDVDAVIMPMTLDTGGVVVYGGTPKRKNHMYAKYMRCKADDGGRWQAWHFTSHDNPHLDETALSEISEDLTEDMYRQEILAQFLDNEGAVFRNVGEAHTAVLTNPGEHIDHFIVAGIDWGKRQDYTVISAICVDCGCEVDLERFNKIDYTYQRRRLVDMYNKWHISAGLAELNAMGEPNFEMLANEGLPIDGFTTTATSKPQIIENLARVVERVEYRYLPNPIAQGEMEAYEVKINPVTNRPTYSAPSGMNDDTVIARALATWKANRHMPALL